MTKQQSNNSKNGKQSLVTNQAHLLGSEYYVREIIKRLTRVTTVSGYGPGVIFNDWIQLVQASLEALPNHLKIIARTGHWAEDSPETAETFARIRARYGYNPSALQRAWESFGQAFALLLESAAPGLWAFDYHSSSTGPDVLGQIFIEYTHPDPHKGQFLTPWPVVLMMSTLNAGAKSLVYDRLKQACQHPDNILAQAALLAGLVIEDPAQAREWFMTRVVPSALPHFEIVKVCDPCVGSGRMLLGMASQFEPWMVQTGLVQFYGQDIDPLMVRLTEINCALYSLNSYGLKLAKAVHEALATRQPEPQSLQFAWPKSPQSALEQATHVYLQDQSIPKTTSPSFEELFKVAAQTDLASG